MARFRILSLAKAKLLGASVQDVFSTLYERRSWGHTESASGAGSDLAQTKAVRTELASLIAQLGIRTLLDAPCGDFFWMKEVPLNLDRYIGADIVPAMIESNQKRFGSETTSFRVLDIIKDPLPQVDLILCRDCLVHLPFDAGISALRNFAKSGSRYLLITTYPGLIKKNAELRITGNWRPVDLQLPPYSLPAPIRIISEQCTLKGDFKEKGLGLWDLTSSAFIAR
jgi:hypothetical protein